MTEIDLDDTLEDDTVAALRQALVRHKVLVFRDQNITPAAHVGLARRFGELEVHPVFPHHPDHPELVLLGGTAASKASENIFHSDVSWRQTPSMASLLRCVECPPAGGDTIWVNMAAAYENLPESLKPQLALLEAVHDLMPAFGSRMTPEQREANRDMFPPVVHPVVRTHPESGEKILYVNEAFTTHLANYATASGPACRRRLQGRRDGPAPLPPAPGDDPRVPDASALGARHHRHLGQPLHPALRDPGLLPRRTPA